MKVGIYGDSFAAGTGPTSWTSILKTKFDATVYAYPGSSLFWSYKNFIETYNNYDSILFLVTDWGRLYSPDLKLIGSICNIFCVNDALDSNIHISPEVDVMKAAKGYYTYLQEPEYEQTVHDLMIENVIRLCNESNKKIILIPCMNASLSNKFLKHCAENFSLSEINNIERAHFGIPHKGMFAERKDRIQNHLSDDNNAILADLFIKLLQGQEIKLNTEQFNHHPQNVELYYDIDKLKEQGLL